jgi:7-cyano-7-deazaguanine reductase
MNPKYLETLPNKHPETEYEIEITTTEFTCLCPGKPDQPDYAHLKIHYTPSEKILELKSLKYYLFSYRNDEIYHEDATNKILHDLVNACSPQKMIITADWHIRGGIKTRVTTRFPQQTPSP